MIKLYYGEDTFSTQREIEKISSDPGLETIRIRNDLNVFINQILSSSFFKENRLFICENILDGLGADEQKKIIRALRDKQDETAVIFIENKEPKGEIKKFILKNGQVVNHTKAPERDIINFINERVSDEGGKISPLAAERLASFVGPDFWQINEEIKKLTLYKKSDEPEIDIQTADVDHLVKSNFEANIFELMDAISTKNQRKAIKLLNQFLESGENEMYIFSMIAKQFRNIALAKFEGITSEKVLAERAGLHPFVAKKSILQARNFDKKEIISIYQKLTEADLSLKSGFDPKYILQHLLI